VNFNRALGLRRSEDGGSVLLEAGTEHEAVPGVVHFAVLATLAEVAAADAALAAIAAEGEASEAPGIVPTHLSLQLLRRARPGLLTARGSLLKSGRSLLFAEGEVAQAGKLVAKATVTFART